MTEDAFLNTLDDLLVDYAWCGGGWKLVFSDDKRNELKEALSRFKPQEIEVFISDLEFRCRDMKVFLRQPKDSEYIEQMIEVVDSLKTAFKHLDKIRCGQLCLMPPRKDFDELEERRKEVSRRQYDDPTSKGAYECFKIAPQAQNCLEIIIKYIEANLSSIELKQGRRKADHHKFVKTIAEIFNEHLGRPSSTKGGPFESVVKIVSGALGVSIKYPDRAIRSALKELNFW